MIRALLVLLTVAAADCGGEQQAAPTEPVSPAPPPDAGRAAGHAADARRVPVPDRDGTPPQAVIALGDRAEAAMPGGSTPQPVRLERTRVLARAIGRDPDSGVARVRISIRELVTCRGRDGAAIRRQRTRYLPPPQIERIRSAPGALLRTELSRSRRLPLSRGFCGRATLERVDGELWGEAINGLGLEAVTPHIPFTYRPSSAPRTARR